MQGNSGNGAFAAPLRAAADVEQVESFQVGVGTGESGREWPTRTRAEGQDGWNGEHGWEGEHGWNGERGWEGEHGWKGQPFSSSSSPFRPPPSPEIDTSVLCDLLLNRTCLLREVKSYFGSFGTEHPAIVHRVA